MSSSLLTASLNRTFLKMMFLLIFPSFRPMGMGAKLAYQVILIIRGRLITPFILGSMSVGLNILIRHSFTGL